MTLILLVVVWIRSSPMVRDSSMSCQQSGVLHLLPHDSLYGAIPILKWWLLLYENSMSANCSAQAPLKSRAQARSMSSNVWIVRSVCPSIVGWNAVLKHSSIPNASYSFCQKPEWNSVSRSHYGMRYSIQPSNLLDIRSSQSIQCLGVSHGYEVCRFGESSHDCPYCVVFPMGQRQTHQEIHRCRIPLPLRDV